MAIDKKRTRHDGCTGWNFRNLCEVYASCLNGSFLLLDSLVWTLPQSKLWGGIELAGPLAFLGEMPWPATIETRLTGLRCLRNGRSVDPLRLRRPIILWPRNILLLHWSNHHLLLPWLLVSQPWALRGTSGRSNCDFSLSLLSMMKSKVFFHGHSIIN